MELKDRYQKGVSLVLAPPPVPVLPVLRDSPALHTPIGQRITVPAPCSSVAGNLPLLPLRVGVCPGVAEQQRLSRPRSPTLSAKARTPKEN